MVVLLMSSINSSCTIITRLLRRICCINLPMLAIIRPKEHRHRGEAVIMRWTTPRRVLQPPPLPAFNPANRVDLIVRTIAQLTLFRIIR